MEKTKISTADSTWNPVSGCYHDCVYCYARGTANRFKGCDLAHSGETSEEIVYLRERLTVTDKQGIVRNAAYPFGFTPTFHEYRLNDPQTKGFGKTVFVCSMADLFGCYDEQTEVFTRDGWKFFRDLSENDLVGYLEEESGTLHFSKPSTITKMPYKGVMYHAKNQVVDLCVTPNHKMYAATRPTTVEERHSGKHSWKFKLVAAEDLYGKSYCIKRDFVWNGDEVETFIVPGTEVSIPMDLWLKFFGYYVSEGSAFTTCGRNRVSMPQLKTGSDFYDVCKEIASLLGNKPQMLEDRCIIQNSFLKDYLAKLGCSHSKFIPQEYKELSSRQIRILLDALIVGDGKKHKHLKTEAYSYYTVSKRLADDVQELAMKCGFVANITSREPRNCHMIAEHPVKGNYVCYEVIITSKTRMPEINSKRNRQRGEHEAERYEPYDGMVYCCEVPSHILLVRRNGKTCWCGNSWVPDDWIKKVFDSCKAAPGHRYLFLTKNPARYIELAEAGLLPKDDNFWYGSTVTNPDMPAFYGGGYKTYASIEPILEPLGKPGKGSIADAVDWAIFGAETGNRKEKVVPERSWVEEVVEAFKDRGKPVFMKDSLKPIWGEDIITEFPWTE